MRDEYREVIEWAEKWVRHGLLWPHLQKRLRLILALARRGAAMRWRPIETAPKNRKGVFLWCNGWEYGRYKDHPGGWECDFTSHPLHPTHWMPDILPPEEE